MGELSAKYKLSEKGEIIHLKVFPINIGKEKLNKVEVAAEVGKSLSKRVKGKKIEKIYFDRNGFRYHGRVKSLADAAREGGLKF